MACGKPLHIPQELVDAILDGLWDDKQTLSACSLVTKSWLERCRCYLFHSLKVAIIDSERPLSSFLTQLGTQLRFGAYVRSLAIVDISSFGGRAPFLQRVISAYQLRRIIVRLPGLLELQVNHVQIRSQPPLELPVARYSRLQRLVISNSDMAVSQVGKEWNPVFETLAMFTHINELIFDSVFDQNESSPSDVGEISLGWELPACRLSTDYLRVRSSTSSRRLLDILQVVLRPGTVKSICVNCMGRDDHHSIGGIVKRAASSLESFRLEFPQYSRLKVSELNAVTLQLHACKSLKTLTFTFCVANSRTGGEIFCSIVGILAMINRSAITTVSLLIRILPGIVVGVGALDWEAADKVLGEYKQLERVNILVTGGEAAIVDLWRRNIAAQLRKLSRRDVIHIQ